MKIVFILVLLAFVSSENISNSFGAIKEDCVKKESGGDMGGKFIKKGVGGSYGS